MALSGDDITGIILQWWSDYQADPRSDGTQILSGLRSDPQEGDPNDPNRYSKYKFALSPCQYWIKGLPGICNNWNGDKCTASQDPDTGLYPTGYNSGGICDSLGRRHWCDHYATSSEKLSEYACVANCMERSGLGKQIATDDYVSFVPYDKSEIAGYNEGPGGIGLCDGNGTGRGETFYDRTLEEKYITPPICKHYRPWIMGFGAIKPRPIRKDTRGNIIVPKTLQELHDGTKYDPLKPMYAQIPFNFLIYNLRARFQKCGYWSNQEPAQWCLKWYGDMPILELNLENGSGEAESVCTCPKQFGCLPYKTLTTDWVHGLPDMVQFAWSEAGTVVCNGAKPECPCYTGKWNYVIDDKMRDGMRITSSQILELRYWADDWENQADYEEAFKLKPGPTYQGLYADPSTDVIFTFDQWNTFNAIDPNQSVMKGRSSKLLIPGGADVGKSFIPTERVQLKEVTYPRAAELGSVLPKDEQSYPTLIRDLDEQGFDKVDVPRFTVVYPADWFTLEGNKAEVTHNVIWMDDTPGVAVIGSSTPEATIYAINLTYLSFDEGSAYKQAEEGSAENQNLLSYFKGYQSKRHIPYSEWRDFDSTIHTWLRFARKKSADYFIEGTADDTGAFYFGPLRIPHNTTSQIVVITDYTGFNNYDFRTRTVYSSFWGTWIDQDSFTSSLPEESDEGVFPSTPYSFTPAAEVKFTVNSIQGTILEEDVFPAVSSMFYGTLGNKALVSYFISEYSGANVSEYWTQLIGNPSYLWADIGSVDINLLHDAKIDRAFLTLKEQDDEEENETEEVLDRCIENFLMSAGSSIELEIAFPDAYKADLDGEEGLKREYCHPKYVLLRTPLVTFTITETGGLVFLKYGEAPEEGGPYLTQRLMANFAKEDWDLNFEFRYQKMEFLQGEEEEGDDEGEAGEGLEPEEGEDGTEEEEGESGLDPELGDDPDFAPPEEEEGGEEDPESNQVWPPANGQYALVPAPITIKPDGEFGQFVIETWRVGSAAIFCYNSDVEGRYWSAAATKLIGQMNYLECKNVDIFYAYKAPAKAYDLQPATGFITWTGPPTVAPAAGGDTSGGTSGGNGDDPGLEDTGPGTPQDTLIDVAGANALNMSDQIYNAPSYYDSGANMHYRKALCGDHECNPGNCVGPMWFPFNNCTNQDYYDVHAGPGACTASLVPEMDTPIPPNFRYGVADQFIPSVSPGGNWASSCGAEWYFHYSEADMGGMQFAGYARVKGRIFRDHYEGMGWALPPFGLSARPFVERFMTRDWTSHLMLVNNQWTTVQEFMPYVLDTVDLENYFNCFESTDQNNPVAEPFLHSSALNWLSLSAFSDSSGELMPSSEDRYRFEEVFDVVWHGLCMYPYPLWQYQFGFRVARYAFKSEDYTWAWRERWNELKRAQNSGAEGEQTRAANRFYFLDLEQPQYYMDKWKEEHRLVTDEGETDILYTGPIPTDEEVVAAESAGEEVPDLKFPAIQLGANGFKRNFNILYSPNEYDDTYVDWQDEGTQDAAGGSGGDDLPDSETADKVAEEAEQEADGEESEDAPNDGSIYEKANDPPGTADGDRKWLHDYNTIFDEFAEAEENLERAAVVGIDLENNPIYKYYNRGLVAGIPKNKLNWLPMEFSSGGEPTVEKEPDTSIRVPGCNVWSREDGSEVEFVWTADTITVPDENQNPLVVNEDPNSNLTPYKIIIKGKWGYTIDKQTGTPTFYCIPHYSFEEELGAITTNTTIEIPDTLSQTFNFSSSDTVLGETGVALYKDASQEDKLKDNLETFELEITIEPWPYRMIGKTNTLTLTLEILSSNKLAISSTGLVNAKYLQSASEHIEVWERKYLPATRMFSQSNPDGPNTKRYRTYDQNGRNAGQYYPAASLGAPVGNFRDKMVIISAGPLIDHDHDQNLSVGSLSGLKAIEANKQAELYDEAYKLDNYDETWYTKVGPPPLKQFALDKSVPFWSPVGTVPFVSQKISWDLLGYQKALITDMDFWQPAGHYFQWGDTGTSTRCYLFGTIRDVYTANFVHAHSDSKYRAMSPGHAYNGWARKEYYAGRQAQLEALGRAGDPGSYGYSDGLTAGKNRQGILAR